MVYISGKEHGDSKEVENENLENEKEEVKLDKREEKKKKDKFMLGTILFLENPSLIVPPFPFPQRFKKAKLDGQFVNFLNMFKKLEVNVLFADALAQMPNYVKFIKENYEQQKEAGCLRIYQFIREL